MSKIAFWHKEETGSFMTASSGLNEKEIALLQSLKPGDRLILKVFASSTKFSENSPDAKLEKYERKQTS